MPGRLNRNRPLPDAPQPNRVDDSKTQRAIDALSTPLRAILQLLQPFVQPQPWRGLPLNDDWARTAALVAAPQYVKDPLGRVELSGSAKTVVAASTTIAVLPEGCRPQLARTFSVGIYDGGRTNGTVDIASDGRVILITPAIAANIEVYFDGIRFDTRV
jgi:hypothetical protein